jgi:hypothetical protein
VYIHWATFYLATNVNSEVQETELTAESRNKLKAELGVQLTRMLTVCEMLSSQGRLDQTCFLLMFLRRCLSHSSGNWWKSRTKKVAKEVARKRPGRQEWHVEFAEKCVKSAVKMPEGLGLETWARRDSLTFSRVNLDPGLWKGT